MGWSENAAECGVNATACYRFLNRGAAPHYLVRPVEGIPSCFNSGSGASYAFWIFILRPQYSVAVSEQ